MLETEDYGKDLATVQNLNKKHQLLEADIRAHEDRVRDLNQQADAFIESGLWDVDSISDKKQSINDRCVGVLVRAADVSLSLPVPNL